MISQEQLASTATARTETGLMVDVRGLVKSYAHKTVVNHVSFSVRQAEIFGVLGPNGAAGLVSYTSRSSLACSCRQPRSSPN